MDVLPSVSPALLEANRRLYELRAQLQGQRQGAGAPAIPTGEAETRPQSGTMLGLLTGPSANSATSGIRDVVSPARPHDPERDTVKLYPDIALGMLRYSQAAPGRIWLLLRYLDKAGRGWVAIDEAREWLSGKTSPLHVCSWRQLRNLLRQGEGIFWERTDDRIWLRSAARVAAALEVERLNGRPIALPVKHLLGGIGQVRAHFYASFHSGRRTNNPISRATLKRFTHVPERSQRDYEQAAGVSRRSNIAIGSKYTAEHFQERAWRHGRATFKFVDHQDQQGATGRVHVAWRLPNSYQGCHSQCPRGRQKKINRQIDLVNSGAQGNRLPTVHRLFHTSGATAGKAYNCGANVDAYWLQTHSHCGRRPLWSVIPAQNDDVSHRETRKKAAGI